MNLKPQYLKFAVGVAGGLSAAKAAANAGYSKASCYNQGVVLLKKPEIMQKIVELKAHQVQAVSTVLTPEDLICRINTLATVTLNEKIKLSAYELLCKCLHMFDDRVYASSPEPLIILNNTSNEIVMTLGQKDNNANQPA